MIAERDQGTVLVLPIGVYFPIADPVDPNKRLRCLYTRAAFAKILGKNRPSANELRGVFHDNRRAIERLAKALYECPARSV
jgi:hypothetical protein